MNHMNHALLYYKPAELAEIGQQVFEKRLGSQVTCKIAFCENTELDVFEVSDGTQIRHYIIEEHLEEVGKAIGFPIQRIEEEYDVKFVCEPYEMVYVLFPMVNEG